MNHKPHHLLLGITGGIAAYKSADLVRKLMEVGCAVEVVMTEAACRFIAPASLQALSGRPVYTDMWDARVANGMPHIELSRDKAAIVVAPATADFLARIAHGLCDDLLSTLCLARDCPLIVAPAMNRQMWEHPATQRNVQQLVRDGVTILGPGSGDQACGEVGMGRMLEPVDLAAAIVAT
ncbi:MAG TPA: flavoprotein, partial [Burkholderiales bacterium]